MDAWRKIQIANGACAVVAVALSVAAYYQPALVDAAVWAWSITLWFFLFIGPLPIIERNKQRYKYVSTIPAVLTLAIIVPIITRYREVEMFTFGLGVLIYTTIYTIVASLVVAWLKIKEKNKISKN